MGRYSYVLLNCVVTGEFQRHFIATTSSHVILAKWHLSSFLVWWFMFGLCVIHIFNRTIQLSSFGSKPWPPFVRDLDLFGTQRDDDRCFNNWGGASCLDPGHSLVQPLSWHKAWPGPLTVEPMFGLTQTDEQQTPQQQNEGQTNHSCETPPYTQWVSALRGWDLSPTHSQSGRLIRTVGRSVGEPVCGSEHTSSAITHSSAHWPVQQESPAGLCATVQSFVWAPQSSRSGLYSWWKCLLQRHAARQKRKKTSEHIHAKEEPVFQSARD